MYIKRSPSSLDWIEEKALAGGRSAFSVFITRVTFPIHPNFLTKKSKPFHFEQRE
jgi:hypothetical protein